MAGKEPKTPDFEEKKEKFLESMAKSKQEKKGPMPPLYFMGLLLALGLMIGAAAVTFYLNPASVPQQPSDRNEMQDANSALDYRTVSIIMVYSEACKTCAKTNTWEDVFRVRKIPYTLESAEAGSERGKELVQRYGLDRTPTAIIDASKIEFYPATKNSFENAAKIGAVQKKQGYYLAPEINLDEKEGAFLPTYFLNPVLGYCDINSTRPKIVQFDDYYTESYVDARERMYNFAKDFSQYLEWKYSFAQSASADDNSIYANIYLTCAGNQGKYLDLEGIFTGYYCNNVAKGDPSVLTDVEIRGCKAISEHYGKPLSQGLLDVSVDKTTGIDRNAFYACYGGAQALFSEASKSATSLGIRRTGTFLVDCMVTSDLDTLPETICGLHPEIPPCRQAPANADTNSASGTK
ncbi:MAG: hypothetical protein HY544_01115 [Candidatus Diapherotrites archaeon]|uniref:Thioredoxin domain-containing protein n=1 Tax=Candidatus Iainarchaeum sp. TaxID=3101447 RepID=A0A8T3YJW5_9ARCH|nr:hypothetical protein [Candidatus Diapherotrites archaeon]